MCLTWSPYYPSVIISKQRNCLQMPLIGEYLNSVNVEKQKFIFVCRVERSTKGVTYQNFKRKSSFLNRNTILSCITMTIRIRNSIITNKIMSLNASFSKVYFPHCSQSPACLKLWTNREIRRLVAFTALCSIKIGWIFAKIGTYIDKFALKICNCCDFSKIVSAIVVLLKICGHIFAKCV